jgi:probable HAF family extracellular repeat protein
MIQSNRLAKMAGPAVALGALVLLAALPALSSTAATPPAVPRFHLTDLGPGTLATRIDAAGRISGFSHHRPAVYVGGAWRGGTMARRSPALCPMPPVEYQDGGWISSTASGEICGQATAMNEAGTVVGWTLPSDGDEGHAFSWHGGAMRDLGTLGGGYSSANDVNDSGTIVGVSLDLGEDPHAFIEQDGRMLALDTIVDPPPEGTVTEAASINDDGRIVANGLGTDGEPHAYLLDPM